MSYRHGPTRCQVSLNVNTTTAPASLRPDHVLNRSIDFSDTENSVEQLEALAQQCQPASFGRGQQDVQDPSYRKAGKLDTTQFSTPFNLAGSGILDVLKDEMLIKHDLRAELYKLNVYGKSDATSTMNTMV